MSSLLLLLLLLFAVFDLISSQSNGDIVLRSGPNNYEGRVDLYTTDALGISRFGPLCDSSFYNELEADVVCRQLGYNGAETFGTVQELGYSSSSFVQEHQLHILCDSFDQHLFDCSIVSTEATCSSLSHFAVKCYPTRLDASPYIMQARLVEGTYPSTGRLEIYCNGQWGTVCIDGFGDEEAATVCQQLGYSNFVEYQSALSILDSSQPIWFAPLTCIQSEICLVNCATKCPVSANNSCAHTQDVVLTCSANHTTINSNIASISSCISRVDNQPPANGPVRLWRFGQTLSTYTSGIVQVYHDDNWGNICNDNIFNQNGADVICNQLGFTGSSSYGSANNGLLHGYDNHLTLLQGVDCKGDEKIVLQCSRRVSSITTECYRSTLDVTVSCYSTRIWDFPFNGMARLQEGEFVSEGRIEVYCNRQWGTICNNGIASFDLDVFCQQLGYSSATIIDNPSLISVNTSQPIWYNNISCGIQECITDCVPCPSVPVTNCNHSQDVAMYCRYSEVLPSSTESCADRSDTTPSGNGIVRLFRNGIASSSFSSGIVQIYLDNEWGNICNDESFGFTEADVVCHQLGYSGSSLHGSTFSGSSGGGYGIDYHQTILDSVYCSSSQYLNILQCAYSTFPSCLRDSSDLYVICYATRIWDNPFSGMLRLTNGVDSNEGRIEVYCNGMWGTICDNGFGQEEADTVCRQLGYTSANDFTDMITMIEGLDDDDGFDDDDIPIWLQEVDCRLQSERCFNSCQTCPVVANTLCNHTQDVTVQCTFSRSIINRNVQNSCRDIDTTTTITPTFSTSRTISPTSTNNGTNGNDIINGLLDGDDVFSILFYVGLVIIPIIICCCTGFCYSCYKHHGQFSNDTGGFLKDWCLCSFLCALYCLFHVFCGESDKRHKRSGIHIEL